MVSFFVLNARFQAGRIDVQSEIKNAPTRQNARERVNWGGRLGRRAIISRRVARPQRRLELPLKFGQGDPDP